MRADSNIYASRKCGLNWHRSFVTQSGETLVSTKLLMCSGPTSITNRGGEEAMKSLWNALRKISVGILLAGFYAFIAAEGTTPVSATGGGGVAAPVALTPAGSDLSLNDLFNIQVSGAGFFSMAAVKAPGYTIVIDQDQLQHSSARSIEDVLSNYEPGITYSSHSRFGAIQGVRGISTDNSSKTLLLLDGQSINQRVHFGNTVFPRLPFLGDIDHLEVMLGPGGIQHGSGALNGFINVIPKTGTKYPGLHVNVEGGTPTALLKLETAYGASYGEGKDFFVYGGLVRSSGYVPSKADQWGFEPQNAYDSAGYNSHIQTQAFAAPTYRIGAYMNWRKFSMNLLYQSSDMTANSYDFFSGTPFDPAQVWHQTMFAGRPKYKLAINERNTIEVTPSVELFDWVDKTTLGWPGDGARHNFGGSEGHAELRAVYLTTSIPKNQLAIGALGGYRSFSDTSTWFSGPIDGICEAVGYSWSEFSGFGEDVFDITKRWTLSGGLRYDYVRPGELTSHWLPIEPVTPPAAGNLSYRLATSFEFAKNTVAKVSAQSGFHYPDAAYYIWWSYDNMYYKRGSDGGVGLKPLKPETMNSFEADFSWAQDNTGIMLDASVYYNMFHNSLSWVTFSKTDPGMDPDGYDSVFNSPLQGGYFGNFANSDNDFNSLGGELKIRWRKFAQFSPELSYAYSTPSGAPNDSTAKLIPSNLVSTAPGPSVGKCWYNYPTHQIKLNGASRPFANDRLILGASFALYPRLPKSAWDPGTPGDNGSVDNGSVKYFKKHAYSRLNASMESQITKHFSLKLSGFNLLHNRVPPQGLLTNGNGLGGNTRIPVGGALGSDIVSFYLEGKINF